MKGVMGADVGKGEFVFMAQRGKMVEWMEMGTGVGDLEGRLQGGGVESVRTEGDVEEEGGEGGG